MITILNYIRYYIKRILLLIKQHTKNRKGRKYKVKSGGNYLTESYKHNIILKLHFAHFNPAKGKTLNNSTQHLISKEVSAVTVAINAVNTKFVPANNNGEVLHSIADEYQLGILYQDHEVGPVPFFDIFTDRPRRPFVGMITFHLNNEWTFEVYGIEYFELVKGFADKITTTSDVKITVLLSRTKPLMERYRGDFFYQQR